MPNNHVEREIPAVVESVKQLFGKPHGFAASTLVKVFNGYKPIEELSPGEHIATCDLAGKVKYSKILSIQTFVEPEPLSIIVNETELITCNTQLFRCDAKFNWQAAKDLTKDKKLKSANSWATSNHIIQVSQIACPVRLYSLSLEHTHNFCITKKDLIVHNFAAALLAAPAVAQQFLATITTVVGAGMYFLCNKKSIDRTLSDLREKFVNWRARQLQVEYPQMSSNRAIELSWSSLNDPCNRWWQTPSYLSHSPIIADSNPLVSFIAQFVTVKVIDWLNARSLSSMHDALSDNEIHYFPKVRDRRDFITKFSDKSEALTREFVDLGVTVVKITWKVVSYLPIKIIESLSSPAPVKVQPPAQAPPEEVERKELASGLIIDVKDACNAMVSEFSPSFPITPPEYCDKSKDEADALDDNANYQREKRKSKQPDKSKHKGGAGGGNGPGKNDDDDDEDDYDNENEAKRPKAYNMNDFFERFEFGKRIRPHCRYYKNQTYLILKDLKEYAIKKGDLIRLDKSVKHCDHLDVHSGYGTYPLKLVLDLFGKEIVSKTKSSLGLPWRCG